MRIVEKLLYGIGGLLALILLFIALCSRNPGIAVKIGERLGKTDENMEDVEEDPVGSYAIKTTVTQENSLRQKARIRRMKRKKSLWTYRKKWRR